MTDVGKLEDASVRLAGVCELLECAANAPCELGSPGLELLAVQACEAHAELEAAIAALEKAEDDGPEDVDLIVL